MEGNFQNQEDFIKIIGAREHNLKNITVNIPKKKITLIKGASGSGKTSLAFDTIYAMAQRRFMNALPYAPSLQSMLPDEPDVDKIEGLTPVIAIQQDAALLSSGAKINPLVTLGTITGVYDFYRALYSTWGRRPGNVFCPTCGKTVIEWTVDAILKDANEWARGATQETTMIIITPVPLKATSTAQRVAKELQILLDAQKAGFARLLVDDALVLIEDRIALLQSPQSSAPSTNQSNATTNQDDIITNQSNAATEQNNAIRKQNDTIAEQCNIEFKQADTTIKQDDATTKQNSAIYEQSNAADTQSNATSMQSNASPSQDNSLTSQNNNLSFQVKIVIDRIKIVPSQNGDDAQSQKARDARLTGAISTCLETAGSVIIKMAGDARTYSQKGRCSHCGGVVLQSSDVMMRLFSFNGGSYTGACQTCGGTGEADGKECPDCHGARLNALALSVKVGGISIGDLSALSVHMAKSLIARWIKVMDTNFSDKKDEAAQTQAAKSALRQLEQLELMGLGDIAINRPFFKMSTGERQRALVAGCIGSGLTDVTYIFDEISRGQHPADMAKLGDAIKVLRDLGNTIIMVDHRHEVEGFADNVLCLSHGSIISNKTSDVMEQDIFLQRGANLTAPTFVGDVGIPLRMVTCITGPSGAGKTLLLEHIKNTKPFAGHIVSFDERGGITSPMSSVATICAISSGVADLFNKQAARRGINADIMDGRCKECKGSGVVKISMGALGATYVRCPVCGGKRFDRQSLDILYKGKNISDVLDMTIDDAIVYFDVIQSIKKRLVSLEALGLGYLTLGQRTVTLSGGEVQRIKLACELSHLSDKNMFYTLDEPTAGLSELDTKKLLAVIQNMLTMGKTVIIAEHNLDVIRQSDYVIDLAMGGTVAAEGTPSDLKSSPTSITGKYL